MFLNLSNAGNQPSELDARVIGWASGLRLGLFYTAFFTLVFVLVFVGLYFAFSPAIHERELEIVRNRASEYHAWFLAGDTEMLQRRMEQQSMETGDVMFVRITGPGLSFVQFNAPGAQELPMEALRSLDPTVEGNTVEIGAERWTVASIPLGERGTLQAGKNNRAAELTLSKLRKVALLTFIPAMMIAALSGAWLTFRSMAPIRRLIFTMRDILRAGDLSQRVEPEAGRNELNALVALFNRLLARNQALIEAMHQSLDNVAHDFRTPLSRLRNTAEQALRDNTDPEGAREALADCVEESEHLGRLVTTLLDVAEAESGAMRLNLEKLSLPDLVESVVELYELVAEDKSIEISTSLPEECVITADRTRFSQVLANLLDNAIKYSPSKSKVAIEVHTRNNRVVVTVRDEGIGIRGEDLPHIWNRLYRAEPSRTTPGMGLGLSFVKAIVEAHGGTVSVKSAIGKGTTFSVELDAA